jgi:hypothetical protein
MTVLLDIDGVLLDWSGIGRNDDFDDWTRPQERYFSHYSPSLLKFIAEHLPDIQWHTTWIEGNMCNEHWVKVTEWGPYPIFIDRLVQAEGKHSKGMDFHATAPNRASGGRGFSSALIHPEVNAIIFNAGWWKLNAVALALEEGLLPGKVLWIDDDLAVTQWAVAKVLKHYKVEDRFRLIIPKTVLRKADIIAGAEWLAKP